MAKAKDPAKDEAPKAASPVLIYKALHTFWLGDQLVRAGDTVAAGNAILKGRHELFEPFQPTFGSIEWGDE